MINDKLRQLIELLTQKTNNKEAVWNKASGDKQFKLILSNNIAVTVSYSNATLNEPEYYGIAIFNSNGDVIQRYYTDDDTSAQDFGLIERFHQAANDAYFKVDETFDSLLESVSRKGTIGTIAKDEGDTKTILSDDDLPF